MTSKVIRMGVTGLPLVRKLGFHKDLQNIDRDKNSLLGENIGCLKQSFSQARRPNHDHGRKHAD